MFSMWHILKGEDVRWGLVGAVGTGLWIFP